ncbi:MAG: hypothetical protein P4L45_09130 [Ignavibacteriaceae bacterium]|nr:hypothetical protein [Ignavibacteriaceae bacterium]
MKSLILTALFGFALCVIIGLIFIGTAIFNICNSSFIILVDGFCGAVFYSVLKYRNIKEQILTGIVILFIPVLIHGRSISSTVHLIGIILFIISLLSSVVCYKLFINKYRSYPIFLRSMALPVFLELFDILATLILVLIYHPKAMIIYSSIFLTSKYAAFIGFGLGIGFDLFELLKNKILPENK